MPYNENLADRVRELLAGEEKNVEEKQMFSGLSFLVDDKMCVNVKQNSIMVRLDPVICEEALEQDYCEPMVRNGKIMKGYLYVNDAALTTEKKLAYWVNLALQFNKFAKSSKKKK